MPALTKQEILFELARRDIRYFVKATQPEYIFAQFNLQILDALSKFYADVLAEKRPILIIEAPPQHGKSELASRKFPAFLFGLNPNLRIAGCSYNATLATQVNRSVQRIMRGEAYRRIFPVSALNGVKAKNGPLQNSDYFDVPGGSGYYLCTGVGGPLTGQSVDIGIIDDPAKNMQEARSETMQTFLREWYQTVFLTRLSKKSGQLIMATRWHEDDLLGYILEKNKGNGKVTELKFPAISETGEALHPKLHPLEKLLDTKAVLDNYTWEALYQQKPILEGGNVIKTEKFRRYTQIPSELAYTRIYADTAMTVKTSSDYSVFALVGYTQTQDVYLLDLWRGKWESPDLMNMAREIWRKCQSFYRPPQSLNIENKASGIGLIQALRREGVPVLPIEPKAMDSMGNLYAADKFQRLCDVLPLIETGRFFVPHEELKVPWLKDFITECQRFRADLTHTHDDQVDAALIYPLQGIINRAFL